jgi:hypothetical protein
MIRLYVAAPAQTEGPSAGDWRCVLEAGARWALPEAAARHAQVRPDATGRPVPAVRRTGCGARGAGAVHGAARRDGGGGRTCAGGGRTARGGRRWPWSCPPTSAWTSWSRRLPNWGWRDCSPWSASAACCAWTENGPDARPRTGTRWPWPPASNAAVPAYLMWRRRCRSRLGCRLVQARPAGAALPASRWLLSPGVRCQRRLAAVPRPAGSVVAAPRWPRGGAEPRGGGSRSRRGLSRSGPGPARAARRDSPAGGAGLDRPGRVRTDTGPGSFPGSFL